jgi:hypothetical protein
MSRKPDFCKCQRTTSGGTRDPAAHDTASHRLWPGHAAGRGQARLHARLHARPGGARRAGDHLAGPARPSSATARRHAPGRYRRRSRQGHHRVLPPRPPGRRSRRVARGDRGRRGRGTACPRRDPRRRAPGRRAARLRRRGGPAAPASCSRRGTPTPGRPPWPSPAAIAPAAAPGRPAARIDPALVYAACQRVLAASGVLAVITASRTLEGRLAHLAGHVVAAACAAGLVNAQYIVLSTPPSTATVLPPDPRPPLPPASWRARPAGR